MLPSLQASSSIHSTFILVCLHHHNNIAQTSMEGVSYKQQAFISYSSGGREIQDQGRTRSDVWWGPASWFTDSHLFAVSSYGQGMKGLPGASFLRALSSFMRAPPMWPNYFPKPPSPGDKSSCVRIWHINFRHKHSDTNIAMFSKYLPRT